MHAYRAAEELGAQVVELRSRRSWFSLFLRRGDDLRVHVDGLAIVRGSRVEHVRWDSVREIRTYARGRGLDHHVLVTTRGTVHEVKLRNRHDSVAPRLYEETLPHLLAVARAGLVEGVRFGPIVADSAGLRSEFAELRWDRVADVRVQDLARTRRSGLIVQGRDHTWMEFALAEVPNPHVLIALFRERRTEERSPRAAEGVAVAALKQLADARERAPDAMTAPARPQLGRRKTSFESSD